MMTSLMAEKGLRAWVKENWVDIANKKAKRWLIPEVWKKWWRKKEKNYPKCVPIAKARAMSKGQRAGAVKRKQAKANTGPTPSRAATFANQKKKKKQTVEMLWLDKHKKIILEVMYLEI